MKFKVHAPFTVEYMVVNPGESHIAADHQLCQGFVEAESAEAALEIVKRAIRAQIPFCWSLKIGDVDLETEVAEEVAP